MVELADDLLGSRGLRGAGHPDGDRAGAHVRRGIEGHVLDVDLRVAEGQRHLSHRSRPVLDPDPQLADVASGEVRLEQTAPVRARGGMPAPDRGGGA